MTIEEPASVTVNIPTPEPVAPVAPVEPESMGNDAPSEIDDMRTTLASISTGMNMLLDRMAEIESFVARIEVLEEQEASEEEPDSEEITEAVKDAVEEVLEDQTDEFESTVETEAGATPQAASESEQPEQTEAVGVVDDSTGEPEQSPRASHFWWRRIGG